MFRSDVDWFSARVDKWVAQCQGYTRLRSKRLSKGCQTMLDRPSPWWSHSSGEQSCVENLNLAALTLEEQTTTQPANINVSQKQLQYDQDIADYIAYLNKPVINMNDHYIEIHQYHYDTDVPLRPPTRRKKHKIDLKKTEIVENKGISSTIQSAEYCEFLVKKELDCNRNIKIVSGRSDDQENRRPQEVDDDGLLDRHRQLSQRAADLRVETVVNREGQIKVKRGQTFSTAHSTEVSKGKSEDNPPVRGFMSFRTARKNKSGRRKKVVVGEKGIDGPIWPAVLLTFDRSVSPGPPEIPGESQV